MNQEKLPTIRDDVLQEMNTAYKKKQAQSDVLLVAIKKQRTEIEALLELFKQEEPDLVYRFYHQSYKFFTMVDLTRQAVDLLTRLAPEATTLNERFSSIAADAMSKTFDWQKTNPIWLEETLPILQAYWHSKYFLEQMLVAADELDSAPETLPSGWAAVLYLYNLR